MEFLNSSILCKIPETKGKRLNKNRLQLAQNWCGMLKMENRKLTTIKKNGKLTGDKFKFVNSLISNHRDNLGSKVLPLQALVTYYQFGSW